MKQLAGFTTHHLVTKGIVTEADAPIYAYGFEVMFARLFTFGSIFFVAACVGNFFETLLFFTAFMVLRIYAGGYHAATRVRCYLISLLMYIIFSVMLVVIPVQWYLSLAVLVVIIALICIALWAPVIHKNRSISPESFNRCRKISLLICIVESLVLLSGQFLLQDDELFFAFGLGTFSAAITVPIAKLADKHIDVIVKWFFERRERK